MKNLTKKEFADILGLDGTKTKSQWQTELRKAESLCNYEKAGRNRYNIHELYDVPNERIHGNTGKTPVNKGAVNKNSFKYQLAELFIQMGIDDYVTKNYYLEKLGFKSRNIKQIESKFNGIKHWELDTLDKYVFKQIQNTNLSIKRLMGEAFDLIRKGIFDNVNLYEQLYVVFTDKSHQEADEFEELYPLYKQVITQATENIKAKYGTSLFFATRMNLINIECQDLIESEEKYQPILDNDIVFFFKKYSIQSTISKNEVSVVDPVAAEFDFEIEDYDGAYHSIDDESQHDDEIEKFVLNFVTHRKQSSIKEIDGLIKQGVTGGFYNKGILIKFADELFDFMFQSFNQETFEKQYDMLIDYAKEAYEEELQDYIDDELSFLPFKAS